MIDFVKTTNSSAIIVAVHNNGRILGELYVEIDGFYVFQPDLSSSGYWNEYLLIVILNKLTELNKPVQEELDKFFEAQAIKESRENIEEEFEPEF